ncbi:MAG: hypothetical protein MJ014_00980 [Methanocorpusculum sp.]|nr:hypothetical protein [Methanocorpusculum sp.]
MTCGSGAHTLREVGRAVTTANDTLTPAEFLEAVLQQKTDVVGCERGPARQPPHGNPGHDKIRPLSPLGNRHAIRHGKMHLRK